MTNTIQQEQEIPQITKKATGSDAIRLTAKQNVRLIG